MNHLWPSNRAFRRGAIVTLLLAGGLLLLTSLSTATQPVEDRVSSNDEALLAPTYGAEPNPTGNPIGGGPGYSDIIDPSQANYTVTNKSELLYALADVQANARDAWGSNNGVIHSAALNDN